MTLFTGHGKVSLICGVRDCKDSEKLLCNNKKNEGAPPRTAFGRPYLHQYKPICDIFRFINLTHETNQWDPYPRQNTALTLSVSDRLSCFGVPLSMFCINQTPLFYSFHKCKKTANDALHHFALIFHLLSHGSIPPSPLVEVFQLPHACTIMTIIAGSYPPWKSY